MLGLPLAVWCVAFDVRRVTRQVQERDDAARQAQQQLEDGQRADTERQQRHETEIESLRSELKAARDDAAGGKQQDDEDRQQQQQQLHDAIAELKASVTSLEQVMRFGGCRLPCGVLLLMWDV